MKKSAITLFIICVLTIGTAFAETLSYIPENPQRALIIIHGYGGSGYGMNWMTDKLKKNMPDMAFYYPTAPDLAPTGGHQWFVIPTLGEKIKDKALYDKMMADAIKNVSYLIDLTKEIHKDLKIPYQNIYVAGFSQGGLMALLTALTSQHEIPVAVSFSGVPLLFTPDFTPAMVKNKPDILIMQGNQDAVIPAESLELTTNTLLQLHIEPTIRVINGMSHQINQTSLQHAIKFIE